MVCDTHQIHAALLRGDESYVWTSASINELFLDILVHIGFCSTFPN